jgi:hypothetical protein
MYNPFSTNIYEAERSNNGEWFYQLFSSDNVAIKLKTEKERLDAVLCNPAALKVFKLQCDLFSLGEVRAVSKGSSKIRVNDPLSNHLKRPNVYQTQRQFLWDYMFWTMLGTSYLYTSSKVLNDNTSQYFLDPTRFVWTEEIINAMDKNIVSKQRHNENMKMSIEYFNLDGTWTKYQLKDISTFFDLSNGVGNWFRGNSSIDALYKVISNSEKALDAKGVNLDFSAKYFASGTHKEDDIYGTPMGDAEKNSIEKSFSKNKPVHATKSNVTLQRFVDDIAALKLDEGYFADYFIIGGMYNIPRDVLEANLAGSTYENQEKARASFVDYCLRPKGEDLMNGLENVFGYDDKNIDLHISWNHLSFMQVVERDRASLKMSQLANLRQAQEMMILTEEEVVARGKEIMEYEG